jgi:hypothetical protein
MKRVREKKIQKKVGQEWDKIDLKKSDRLESGWGAGIRTPNRQSQSLLTYH